jgi:IS5 family transposase
LGDGASCPGSGQYGGCLGSPNAGPNTRLRRIAELVEWSGFATLLADLHASGAGRPSWPPLLMFRCLLLQQWYGLSDPAAEEALNDRLSVRAFVGLALDEAAPDHSALSRFRSLLAEPGRQFDARGLILREGTLIDASLVEADARPRRHRLGTRCESDRDVRWVACKGRGVFGYKAHVAVEAGSGLIRAAVLTPANIHDSALAEQLIQGDEAAVHADRGDDQAARRARLAERGIAEGIMRRTQRNTSPPRRRPSPPATDCWRRGAPRSSGSSPSGSNGTAIAASATDPWRATRRNSACW